MLFLKQTQVGAAWAKARCGECRLDVHSSRQPQAVPPVPGQVRRWAVGVGVES
jgi:hypothetical protein